MPHLRIYKTLQYNEQVLVEIQTSRNCPHLPGQVCQCSGILYDHMMPISANQSVHVIRSRDPLLFTSLTIRCDILQVTYVTQTMTT